MDNEKRDDFRDAYNEAYGAWSGFLNQANIDLRFYENDQWNASDVARLKKEDREPLVFNRLKKVADIVAGYEQRNRLVLKIGPIGTEDDAACSQFNKILPVVMNYDAYETISETFLYGPCVSGSNLLEFWPDEKNDFRFARWPHTAFLLSPTLSKKDLSDCGYVILGKLVTKDEAKVLIPWADKEIESIGNKGGEDIIFPDLPHRQVRGRKDRYQLNYFWQRDTKRQKFIVNRVTGEQTPWRGTSEALKQLMAQYWQILTVITKPVRTVKLDCFIGGEPIGDTQIDPYRLGDYNFVWLPGHFAFEQQRSDLKLQGIIRVARDTQIADNRRLMSMIDILDSQVYSSDYYEEDALMDMEDAFKAGAGRPVFFKKGKLQTGYKERQHKDIPAGMIQLQQLVHQMLIDLPGLNEEIIGSEEKEVPGILSKLRTGAALTIMQSSFDNLRFAKKCLGRKLVRMIQNLWPDQKIMRIIQEPLAAGFRDPDFTRFDCTPQEGLLTATQREMAYAELKSLKDQGWPIPYAAIIDVAPIAMKENLKKHLIAAEQQQQKLQQLEMNQQQIMQALQKAKLMGDMASAQERRTQAIENIANAQLDRIKTAKEIQKFDFDNIMALLDRLKALADSEIEASRSSRANSMTRR